MTASCADLAAQPATSSSSVGRNFLPRVARTCAADLVEDRDAGSGKSSRELAIDSRQLAPHRFLDRGHRSSMMRVSEEGGRYSWELRRRIRARPEACQDRPAASTRQRARRRRRAALALVAARDPRAPPRAARSSARATAGPGAIAEHAHDVAAVDREVAHRAARAAPRARARCARAAPRGSPGSRRVSPLPSASAMRRSNRSATRVDADAAHKRRTAASLHSGR